MKILEETPNNLTIQTPAIVVVLGRLVCGLILIVGAIGIVVTQQTSGNLYIFGLLTLLGFIGLFIPSQRTFYLNKNENKLTVKKERLLGKSTLEYSLENINVRVKIHEIKGKKGVLLYFYELILERNHNSKKINLSGRTSGSYIWQRDEAVAIADKIRSFVGSQQTTLGSKKQNWDIEGEVSVAIIQHTPSKLVLQDPVRQIWLFRLCFLPFLLVGCVGLLLSIFERALPNWFMLIFLTLGIVGFILPSVTTLEIDKQEKKLRVKVARFFLIKKLEYPLDEVKVNVQRSSIRQNRKPAWKVILETIPDAKTRNLFSYNLNRNAAMEVAELIRSFL